MVDLCEEAIDQYIKARQEGFFEKGDFEQVVAALPQYLRAVTRLT